ncbi:hypothetical protein [Methylotenera sp. G11]|uniref:hypothetical protein n=1 Tax=Methylotenera sp. G11 TaxID=1506585 RepID=UPI0006462FF8|nr:hypothetical protein [Methylotenera sp. G11]
MPPLSDYEFTQDLYHNNYATAQQIATGLEGAKTAGDERKIKFYEGLAIRTATEEAEVFQAGVAAANGDAGKFVRDVLKTYPDIKDSAPFKLRLQEAGFTITELGLDEMHKAPKGGAPKLVIAQVAGIATAAIADYQEASQHIHQSSFGYLTEEQRSEYPHVYAAAKLLQNSTSGLNPDFEYSIFRNWATKVHLHEEDLLKLDPTPVTQNNIKHGLPAGGFINPQQDWEI